VSPSANAAFYIALMLFSFLTMVPAHLSTVLFAIASAAPEMISESGRSPGMPSWVTAACLSPGLLSALPPGLTWQF